MAGDDDRAVRRGRGRLTRREPRSERRISGRRREQCPAKPAARCRPRRWASRKSSPKPIILFIDESHTLIGAGGAAGTGDAANLLKPALARGTLRTVAATTWAEYKKHIEKDPALTPLQRPRADARP